MGTGVFGEKYHRARIEKLSMNKEKKPVT